MAEETKKPIWKSKFIIMGAIEVVVGVLLFINGQIGAGSAVTIKGVIDVALRLVTKQAIKVVG